MSAHAVDAGTIASAVTSVIAFFALSAGSLAFARQIDPDASLEESVLAQTTISLVVLTGGAIVLGGFGALTLPAWLAVTIASATVLFAVAWRNPSTRIAALSPATDGPSPWFAAALGGLAFAETLFVSRNPPADRDSLTYHLPMAAHWFMTHALGAPLRSPPESATYYPGNLELVQLADLWAVHSDALIGVVNVVFLWLLALGVRRLAIRTGGKPLMAEMVALLVATSPVCAQLLKGLSADAAMAACVVAAILFLIRWRQRGRAGDMALAVLALGWVAGCRFTGPAYAVLVLGIAWLAPGRTRDAKLAPWWAFALALGLGGFWLVRNTIAIGNPFYPAETQFLGHTLPGTLPLLMLRRTTQLAAWREHWAGQLTLPNLWTYYRFGLLLLLGGGIALAWPAARRNVREAWTPLGFALAASALYLVSFYSGVNLPSVHGEPPMLASNNVRYLLPAFASATAVFASPLGVLLPPAATIGLLGAASLAQLVPMWTRIAFAFGVMAALLLARRAARRVPSVPMILTSALVVLASNFAAGHEKLVARVWDTYETRLALLPAGLVDSLRQEAHGRLIATTGLEGSWQIVGPHLQGRPAYIPVTRTWRQARSMWDFTPDDRTRGTRERWLANLRESGATFVAIGWDDTSAAPAESLWCSRDTARFTLRAAYPRRLVYAVR